jgi:N-acetylglutamate synthase-like GNAT family acetyltransferase
VSSFQPNPLPDGYSLRLATEEDLIRIFYFECFSHDSNSMNRVLGLILFLFISTAFIPEFREKILLIFVFGLMLFSLILLPAYQKSVDRLRQGSVIFWIVYREDNLCGYICRENMRECKVISRLLVGDKYRNRGLGSNLLYQGTIDVAEAIYLTCLSSLKPFYVKFGFIDANYSNAPAEISQRLKKTKNTHLMTLDEASRRLG